METTYLFKTDLGRFIINDERSELGYLYPRIFVECQSGYVNIDICMDAILPQSKEDFESWIDGNQIENKDFLDVCKELGLNDYNIKRLIKKLQEGE